MTNDPMTNGGWQAAVGNTVGFLPKVLVIISLFIGSFLPASLSAADFLVGRPFETVLARPLGSSWSGTPLREILRGVESAKRISILLDRRLDPSVELKVAPDSASARESLEGLVRTQQGSSAVVGNLLYLGPTQSVARLRTTIALRGEELRDTKASSTRQLDLSRKLTVQWEDLDTPRDVLTKISATFALKIGGIEKLSHDLWAGATLPGVNAAEALTLVLCQFDLTFRWEESGDSVTLVAWPETVQIERRHSPPRGTTAAAVAQDWPAQFPGITARAMGNEVVVSGTVEQHEAIEQLRRPATTATTGSKLPPLNKIRLAKFRWDGSLLKLFEGLSKAPDLQLSFEYDAKVFEQAGIDLDQRFQFEVLNATVDQLLHKAFDPLKIKFVVKDRVVTLMPAESP